MKRTRSKEENTIRSYLAKYDYRVSDPKVTKDLLQLGSPRNFQRYLEHPEELKIADLRRMRRTLKFSKDDLLTIVTGE